MERDILKKMKKSEGEDNKSREYNPPDEKLVDSELVHRLVEHYITEIADGQHRDIWRWWEAFKSEVETLESLIQENSHNFPPQLLIDSLIIKLADESERKYSCRMNGVTQYLTAVVQALYNLDYTNEFVIDIRDWPVEGRIIGRYLQGKPDKPLILDMYGRFAWCCLDAKYCNFTFHDFAYGSCDGAEYCNFIFYGEVGEAGNRAGHCNFTFHKDVTKCGLDAENCTFSLMPDADLKWYWASRSKGNKLRRMNEDGEWEEIE